MTISAEEATLIAVNFLRKAGHTFVIATGAELKDGEWVITVQTLGKGTEVMVDKYSGNVKGFGQVKG